MLECLLLGLGGSLLASLASSLAGLLDLPGVRALGSLALGTATLRLALLLGNLNLLGLGLAVLADLLALFGALSWVPKKKG